MENLAGEEGGDALDAALREVLRENDISPSRSELSKEKCSNILTLSRLKRRPSSVPNRVSERRYEPPGEKNWFRCSHSAPPERQRLPKSQTAPTGSKRRQQSSSNASVSTSHPLCDPSEVQAAKGSGDINRRLQRRAAPLGSIKSSEEALLSQRLIYAICATNLEFTWIVLAPSLIGHDLMLNTAALTFSQAIELHMLRISGIQNTFLLQNALINYAKALRLLRRNLSGLERRIPATTAAVAWLLGHSDLLIDVNGFMYAQSFYHRISQTFLSAQSRIGRPEDPVSRALLQDMYRWEFVRAFVDGSGETLGFDPPFDEENWASMEPFSFRSREVYWDRLQFAAQRMIVRLTRLARSVRHLQEDLSNERTVEISEAIGLAESLLGWENQDAEKEMLESLKKVPTQDEGLKKYITDSFDFDNANWMVALRYWCALLTITRLSILLNKASTRRGHAWLSLDRSQSLLETHDQIIYRMLMTVQSCFDRGMLAKLPIVQFLVIVWGCLSGREALTQNGNVSASELQKDILDLLGNRAGLPTAWHFKEELIVHWAGVLAVKD